MNKERLRIVKTAVRETIRKASKPLRPVAIWARYIVEEPLARRHHRRLHQARIDFKNRRNPLYQSYPELQARAEQIADGAILAIRKAATMTDSEIPSNKAEFILKAVIEILQAKTASP